MKTIDEVLEVSAQVLIRLTVMGVVVLLIWWGALQLFGDIAYSVHSRIAAISRQQFDLIHYVGLLMTKAAVALLFFFPFLAVRLVIRKRRKQSSDQAMEMTS
jgi:Family of unknown function (DUF6868)